MKTITKSILVAALGGAFSTAAVAGPGIEYWQKRFASAPTAAKPAADASAPASDHLLVRNTGPGADRIPWVSVSGSAVAAPVKAQPAEVTGKNHVLVHNTGPGSSRVPWKSVTSTPEMLKANADASH